MNNIDVFTTFFFLASVSLVVVSALLAMVLFRINRILSRIDRFSEDALDDVKNISHFFRDLRDNAIVSGLSLLIETFVAKAEKNKKKR